MSRVEIDVFGQTFTVMAEDESRLREAASYVDRQMKDLSRTTATVDSFRLAVLTALNIADERREFERRIESRDEASEQRFAALRDKADRLIATMDQALAE